MEIFWAIGLVLLALACPVGMVGMGVGAWVIARARGQKKQLSVGCMPGHDEQPAERGEDGALKEQVARLEREIESLRTRGKGASHDNACRASSLSDERTQVVRRRI